MRLRTLTVAALLVLCPAGSEAGEGPRWVDDLGPVPAGARLVLTIEGGAEHRVGDALSAKFVIHNDGDTEFKVVVDGSGDRRGHEHLEATDETGNRVVDPRAGGGHASSGPMGAVSVPPGGSKHVKGIPWMGMYLRFDRPGTFRLRAWLDLGWNDTAERKNPVAEATLVLRRPTPEEAAAEVERRLETLRARDAGNAHMREMYDPRYVAPLSALVERGEIAAIEGLRSIDDPSAVEVLLAATRSRDGAIVRKAASALVWRVPPRPDSAASPPAKLTDWLPAWGPPPAPLSADLADRIRKRGIELLAETGDAETASSASVVLRRLGESGDVAAVVAFLDRMLPLVPRQRPERDESDRSISSTESLNSVTKTLLEFAARGAARPADLRFAGSILLYLATLDGPGRERPVDADDRCLGWLSHRVSAVVQGALRALSPAGLERALDRYEALSNSDDVGIRLATFERFVVLGSKVRGGGATGTVRRARNPALLTAAAKMAVAQGLTPHLADAWMDRLSEDGMLAIALGGLADLLLDTERGVGGQKTRLPPDQVAAIEAAWREFAKVHRREILEGKRWALGDAALTPALFGGAITFRRNDGSTWPAK